MSRALLAGLAAIAVLGTGSIAAQAATLTANPTSVAFGKVRVGTSATITLTEQDGDAALTVDAVVDNANFTLAGVPTLIAASGMDSFDVTCAAAGDHSGTITVSWTGAAGGGSIQIGVSCNAPAMWIATSADPFGFPGQEVGTTSAAESFVITNDSGAAAEITNVTTAGTDCAEFPIATDPLPIALAADATTTIMVQFAPSFRGSHTCTLTVVDNVAGIADNTLGLTGTGEGAAIQLTPAGTIDFGDQRVGTTSAAMTMTITNNGDPGYALDVTGIGKSGTAAAEFTLGGFASGSIAPGASENVTITFSPSATGTRNATLTVNTSEPSGITASKNVTGNGVQRLLVPDPTTVEIGEVRINGSTFADGTLQMTNPGGATVTVTNLALAGGQAADFSLVSPPTLPHDIAGGSQSPLTLRCDPSAIGLRSTTLTITSNDDGPSPDDVTVRCTGVRSYVSMSSVAEINFGDVLVGTTGSSPLTVSNLNNANVVSLNGTITAAPSTFSSTVTVISNLAGGGSIPFEVQFSPTTEGTVTGTLTVATDDPVTPTITITLTGRGVRPDITLVAPSSGTLAFGNVQVGSTSAAQTVTVRNDGTSDLTISGVTRTGVNPGQFSHTNPSPLPIVLAPLASANFSVTCSPTSVGNKSATLRFSHDDIWGGDNPLDVALTCTGVQAALTVSPSPIAYGDVRVCENSDIDVTLRNSGTASLTVENIMTSGSQFAIVSPLATPFTLAPSETSTFTLRFEPTIGGSATGSLTVQSTDPNSPAVVAISGNGVVAQMGISATSHNFGDVRIDQAFPQQGFTITNTGTANFTLMSLGSTNNTDFAVQSVVPTLPATLTPTQTATFSVQARPQTLGAKSAIITANTDIPNAPCGMAATTLSVMANGVVPDIGLAPNAVSFGPHDLQAAPAVQNITISNTGTAPLEISDLQLSGTDAARFAVSSNALPFTIPVSSSSVVQVTYTPAVVSSGDAAVLRATTDAQSGVNMDIPLTGRGIDRAIFVTTTQLDFPQTYRNTDTPSQLSFDVRNTGEAPLAITMVTKTGGGENAFRLVDMIPATIGGTSSETVVVEFSPTSSGDFSALLVLTNDDDQRPMVEIGLAGQGRIPNFAPAVGEYQMGRIGVGIPTRLTAAIPDGVRFVNMEPQAFTVRELRLVDQDGVVLDESLARVVGFQVVAVGAAETYTVDVELTAEQPGTYDVTLEVFLDTDPDRVSFVTIRAEAVEVRLRGGGCDAGGGGGAGMVALMLAVLLGLGARRRRAERVMVPLAVLALVALGSTARADRTRNLDLGTFQPMP
ncbi:MAG TPA: choice-of-anchor D domain-containing protein, partial [Kofleriaceae bacterium]|nr:choice-of-anchor D domain-containing protein [Kofleriaceae bacterium]